MALHEELLKEGTRTAPEARTAEEWNTKLKRAGRRAGATALIGVALLKGLKTFALGHLLFRFGGWWGIVALGIVALVVVVATLLHNDEDGMAAARVESEEVASS